MNDGAIPYMIALALLLAGLISSVLYAIIMTLIYAIRETIKRHK